MLTLSLFKHGLCHCWYLNLNFISKNYYSQGQEWPFILNLMDDFGKVFVGTIPFGFFSVGTLSNENCSQRGQCA